MYILIAGGGKVGANLSDTLLDMGQLNPHGRFVHLYLNGAYWGIFHLRERWSASYPGPLWGSAIAPCRQPLEYPPIA